MQSDWGQIGVKLGSECQSMVRVEGGKPMDPARVVLNRQGCSSREMVGLDQRVHHPLPFGLAHCSSRRTEGSDRLGALL
jgi:hypothetical protein